MDESNELNKDTKEFEHDDEKLEKVAHILEQEAEKLEKEAHELKKEAEELEKKAHKLEEKAEELEEKAEDLEEEVKEHEREHTIIVNGTAKLFKGKMITYAQVVQLAFGTVDTNPNMIYSVAYSKGEESKPIGTMVQGDEIKVKGGMKFSVTASNKS